jgi:hypothetical protein
MRKTRCVASTRPPKEDVHSKGDTEETLRPECGEDRREGQSVLEGTSIALACKGHAIYRNLSMVEVGLYKEQYTSLRCSSFHAIVPKTVRRGPASQPVLMSDKL